jgi:hypothetical protein
VLDAQAFRCLSARDGEDLSHRFDPGLDLGSAAYRPFFHPLAPVDTHELHGRPGLRKVTEKEFGRPA